MYKGTAYEQELAMQRWKVSLAPCVPCPLLRTRAGARGHPYRILSSLSASKSWLPSWSVFCFNLFGPQWYHENVLHFCAGWRRLQHDIYWENLGTGQHDAGLAIARERPDNLNPASRQSLPLIGCIARGAA